MGLEPDADAVQSRKDFVAFLRALLKEQEHETGWENFDLCSFLRALSSGTYDNCRNLPKLPRWNVIARSMAVARYYE